MKMRLADFEQYTRNAPQYRDGLVFVQSGIENKDTDCMVTWLRRLCQRNDGLSFMLVTSCHDSKGFIEKKIIRTGKVGRPKIVVTGKKAEKHYHGLIVNENEETEIDEIKKALGKQCRRMRKRKPHLKRQKIKYAWHDGLPIVSYMTRQMNETKPYKYGGFDFGYFDDIRYCKYPDDDNYDDILEF